jgi:hypothetical protein
VRKTPCFISFRLCRTLFETVWWWLQSCHYAPWPQNRVHAWVFLTFESVSGADGSTETSSFLLEVLHKANGFSTGHSGECFASRLARALFRWTINSYLCKNPRIADGLGPELSGEESLIWLHPATFCKMITMPQDRPGIFCNRKGKVRQPPHTYVAGLLMTWHQRDMAAFRLNEIGPINIVRMTWGHKYRGQLYWIERMNYIYYMRVLLPKIPVDTHLM